MKSWLKEHRAQVLINAVLMLLAAACIFGFVKVRSTLTYTNAAKEWAGESGERFAYVSCFLPVNGKVGEETVRSFESAVNAKLVEASMEAEEGKSLWKYAYSGAGNVNVTTERGSSAVYAMGVGGDFFSFHRMFLRSGNYIAESDLMHDRVVLDKELAWKLFGAIEVDGMELEINGKRFIVAGVVERDGDFASSISYPENSRLYMAYDVFNEMTGEEISCCEAVLPNPVSGFAKNMVTESFTASGAEAVEVSARYRLGNIFDIIGSFGKRSMRTDGIIYPSWENAARLTEDYCALFLVLFLMFMATPLCFGAVLAYKYGKRGAEKLGVLAREKATALYDRANDRLYEREQSRKE